jgi:phosphoglycerate dehydrogenase-like enzyme
MTPAVASRNITVTTAHTANSRPVAEYTLAMILLSLKHAFPLARRTRRERTYPDRNDVPGCYGSTVGLVSVGEIARILLELLRPFDLRVLAYDPFLTAADAQRLGVELTSLDDLFLRSDVVSLHTPLLSETVGLITGAHIASMKHGTTFINTARGPVVREDELLDVLARRPDLQAVLDVASVEPPAPDSLIYTLPNVLPTPHLAGSAGPECRRMGRCMVEELGRFVRGEPLQSAIDFRLIRNTSNRFLPDKPHRIAALAGGAAVGAETVTRE